MSDPAVTSLREYLACENDEGYGCDCCPGRPEAYAALERLEIERAAVLDEVVHMHVWLCDQPDPEIHEASAATKKILDILRWRG